MKRFTRCLTATLVVACASSLAVAQHDQHQPAKDAKPAAPGKDAHMQPPPGMSEADMQACIDAATPGVMHEHLAKGIGTWKGKCKSYMGGPEPVESECTTIVTGMLDGRFVRSEMSGDMPGMGPYNGFAITGFDKVSQKFQQTWVDNFGTGMMVSTGELSADGKTLNWTGTYNCPIKKGPITCRIVEHFTSDNSMSMEMYGPNPMEAGKEMKMMEISYTRAADAKPAAAPKSSEKAPTKPGH